MGYAIKNDGSWRAVGDGMVLDADETYADEIPQPSEAQRQAELLAGMELVVESLLDATAQERGYDNRLSICGYVSSPNQTWAAEATAFVDWRDSQVWPACYAIMAACQAGEREIPQGDALLQELPRISWPK